MGVTAVVGANWGDEGKGKIVDALAPDVEFVVRFQGGSNAGHTIINHYGKFALHLLPSGVFYEHITNVIGPGVAFNAAAFVQELEAIVAKGVPEPKVAVSDRAQLLLPYHKMLDTYEEERLGKDSFGSTKSGIAPFYADKYLKVGVQVGDLFDRGRLRDRIDNALPRINHLLQNFYGQRPFEAKALADELAPYAETLRPWVCDTTALLHDALDDGRAVLLEGQLGALRDPDHGIYPFSTSSSTLAGYGAVGAGVPPHAINRVIAVVKAYSSCVGAGPFVTEQTNAVGDELRERGGDNGEYGATTGRPRRIGWFDSVATRYGCRIQGATEVALTLLDVLGYLDAIPICTAYEIDGQITTDFPRTGVLERAKPVYQEMPGWKEDISHVRNFDGLPTNAQRYVREIERLIGVPVKILSLGPKREHLALI
ncbi:MAG: adenylosuccinate synthase [Candidatus Hydrogenedentales bacterium]